MGLISRVSSRTYRYKELKFLTMDAAALQKAMMGQNGKPSPEKDLLAGNRKNNILTQILDQSARARLNNIGAVDAQKLAQVEGMLIRMAQQGQIQQKLDENGITDILKQISAQQSKGPKVTYNRRKVFDSDEDDDDEW